MARKNHKKTGREARERRRERAAERMAEYDSLNAFEKAQRNRENFDKYKQEAGK